MQPVRVAIAEDHKIFRKGIILSMQPYPNIHFIAEAANGHELIAQLNSEALPEVVLMDIRMPGMDGIETTKYLTSHYPQVRVICLTMFEDRQFVNEMISSGARAYLLKNAEPKEINAAIIEVIAGEQQHSTITNSISFNKNVLNNTGRPGNANRG
jgi:DNA-binding NarL/FixJ family response regulator